MSATNSRIVRGARFAASLVLIASVPVAWADGKKSPSSPIRPHLAARRDLSKGNTMYVVPYAHLDTQWRWAYPQVIREFIANTLHRNFDLIEAYPNYVFNFSGSRRYEMMKQYYPAEYERLKGYVKAGRWFPCGSSVDENDANVPSAESLTRQILYGNRFFRKEFGIASDEYMLPDCFGFPYALPSILAHCGIKGFSTQKLTWGSAVGIPFKVGTWEGPDGKSVVAALDPGGYGSRVDEDLSQNTSWLARIQNTGKLSGAYVDYKYYGTGDTGGGPTSDSVNWVEKSIASRGPISVVSSHADEMFNSLTPEQIAKLPHYKGELLLVEHSAGSISSQAMMKRWNRKNELLAQAAEEASVGAMLLGGATYPSERIYNAWDLVLGSQMHDMLPGTSIPKAYEFCWNDELLASNQFAAIETSGVGAVAALMDTRPLSIKGPRAAGTSSLVVYNPLSIQRRDLVTATVPAVGIIRVIGPEGEVPVQRLAGGGRQTEIAFIASVPACGLQTYTVSWLSGISDDMGRHFPWADGAAGTIENEALKVTVNAAGDIASIYDKSNKREVLKSPVRLAFQYENPRQFPAWNMDWADQQKPPRGYVDGPARISVAESGRVRATLRVEREAEGSKFVQDISLTAGGKQVEVRNHIDWQSKECALKAVIPLAAGNPNATYDLQVGAIERGNNNEKHYEVPSHQWFDLTNPAGTYGSAILNDSKFASDKPDDNTLRLTLIYTPGTRAGFGDQATQDTGRHDILFAIAPHADGWRKAGVPWLAKRLNQPLRAFLTTLHPGKLGKSFSLISTSSSQVEIQAVKKAEGSGNVVVRLRELTGSTATNVKLSAARPVLNAWVVDGQERRLDKLRPANGTVSVSVGGYSLKALEMQFAPAATDQKPVSAPLKLPFDSDVASSVAHPTDGSFDGTHALVGELLPGQLTVDGIDFYPGSGKDGLKNALTARGQTIPLKPGYDRVYLLAASSKGDVATTFTVGSKPYAAIVQDWGGYVGQWDNRLWASDPGPNFSNYTKMSGLVPGYVKPGEVAWFANHNRTAQGNTFYEYSYLYKLGFDIPAGARAITMPNNSAIKVLAISVARNTNDEVRPAAPLYDQLADHRSNGDKPSISASGSPTDVMTVTITPGLYWRKDDIRYTLDGSKPTASSPVYGAPFLVNDPTTVRTVELDANGRPSQIVESKIDVRDQTAPTAISATRVKEFGLATIRFSEPVEKTSAENLSNYGPMKVESAHLGADHTSVDLVLAEPGDGSIVVSGVKDVSRAGNPAARQTLAFVDHGAVLSQAAFEPRTSKTFSEPALPVKAGDSWTLNFWCKIDQRPADRTMIAGFGRASDGRTGTGRYICQFPKGISFWSADRDVFTTTPLDLGKWQMLTATYDGETIRLYKNGDLIGAEKVELADDSATARAMPLDAWDRQRRFGGEVRDLSIWNLDLPPDVVKKLASQ